MAKQVISRLIDDIDGGDASETVMFGLEGVQYEIDLSEDNAGKLREALADYVVAGTRVGRSSGTWRPGITPGARRGSRVDNKAVRVWAAENGYELSDRGRIPGNIVDAYTEALKRPAAPAETSEDAPAKPRKRASKKAVPEANFQAA